MNSRNLNGDLVAKLASCIPGLTGVSDRKCLYRIITYSVYSKYQRLTVNRCLIRSNVPIIWKSVNVPSKTIKTTSKSNPLLILIGDLLIFYIKY